MSKYFDPLKVFIPNADELGVKIGEYLPKVGTAILEAAKRFKIVPQDLDQLPEGVQKVLPELLKMAGGGIEIPRDKLPDGPLGEVLHEYLNEIIDAMGRGAADKMQQKDGKGDAPKPGDKNDKTKASDKDGGTPADPKARLGYVVNGRWYPSNCTHVARPWGGKGQKAPEDITLEEALARNHSYCRDCVRDIIPAAAKAAAKPDQKDDEPKLAFKEHPLPNAEHTLFDLWQQLYDDVLQRDGDLLAYRGSWDEFVRRTEHDPDLKGKFILAFNRRGTFAQFKRLVLGARGDHWHHHLDLLLGSSKPSASALKKLAEKEREQWERAVKGVTDWIKRCNVAGQEAIDKDEAELALLKARYHGTSETGQPLNKWPIITLVSLAIMLGSIIVIWQTLN